MKILITGVTRGLGRALADHYIAAGHTVIGCGRGAEGVLDLRFSHPAPQDFSVVDVADASKVDLWAERVLAVHGAPDFLINNAGLMNTPAPLWDVPADQFSKVIDVNIKGVANVIRAFVPAMIAVNKGVIVNFSSGWGRSASPKVAPYCASKWAVEGLTKAFAEELPGRMAAVSFNPGVIDTDMLRKCWFEGAANYPKAEAWAARAAPFILKISADQNGEELTLSDFAA
jgi:NAD(P)-dependent dehydrogenase (short-subunit alcohol dehydrogenase family)